MLAVLMGGGLVLFGIGGDVSGGLFDAFSGGGGGRQRQRERSRSAIEENEERVKANPRDEAALQGAGARLLPAGRGPAGQRGRHGFPTDAKDELRKARRQLGAPTSRSSPRSPTPRWPLVALQVYDPNALNKPKEAQEAARAASPRLPNDAQRLPDARPVRGAGRRHAHGGPRRRRRRSSWRPRASARRSRQPPSRPRAPSSRPRSGWRPGRTTPAPRS